ncbi:MAG TPA: class I SAM-dependent methyltransferase [Nitrospiraceae bacterium]|jgi:tRNA G46 methylase TrmB|nr:class I SAM-dependent methyltransferase [Nitrospiraceae bacterium]
MINDSLLQSLHSHLAWWGLRQFTSDESYFQWQQENLSSAELTTLHREMEQKRRGSSADEVSFYDATAHPNILPVLYSQRYDYYLAIGSRVADRIGESRSILDVGCGVGILTTFYARLYPDKTLVGIDRSSASIARAQEQAKSLGLANVRFECLDLDHTAPTRSYDLILATHALVQAEQDPGIPSQRWNTFERAREKQQQAEFERRTGLGTRLDLVSALLSAQGRMIVFEKTRQLARRVPLQRALAARDLGLIEQPELIRYRLVEEIADDGPFYVLGRGAPRQLLWDESPEPDEGRPYDRTQLKTGPNDPDAPLYENHWPSAQIVWEQLDNKHLLKETTRQEPDSRQLHVELGQTAGRVYLYCANTFDQRQLVIVEPARTGMLESYYQEIASGTSG